MKYPDSAPDFLEENGWGDGALLPLAGDASFRRYFRVVAPGRTAVLMHAPPETENSQPFLDVATHLNRLGFAAPRIMASNLEKGLILLEDFGDARMREVVDAAPESEARIYRDAVTLLGVLHRSPAGDLPPYTLAEYLREALLFTEWYAPAVDITVDEEGYEKAFTQALGPVLELGEPVTVLRDYHAENLMLLEGRHGIGALGLLDFQDALAGHPAYDLVSLLQDARRDVNRELEENMLTHYRVTNPDAAGQGFEAAYAVLGAQRNAKILGIFTRLWKRDGKSRYLSYQARVWKYLERDLRHPALAPVAAWFSANVPSSKRAAAWEGVSTR
ncbi:aminoglycoside phosphotransferase family protein [Parasphingopyxis marina]|uniref:Phosphotransferase n=1 Tax=Parasphingopyxis marina TaxID=2761622 RepID=A0A842HZC4_9SPHN|nr:phosphotransferase [Parasphingopyxis marina]MBC2777719.1 phosphotransferase [Parasphingopyxis marina]